MDLPQAVSRKGGGISMKKGWKIFWIVCAATAAIGFVCCVIAKVLGVTTDMIEGRFPHGIGVIRWMIISMTMMTSPLRMI